MLVNPQKKQRKKNKKQNKFQVFFEYLLQMSYASKQHMQVPKIFFPPVYSWHSTELFTWKCFKERKKQTLRGFIDFWIGVLFPFVSDMRHKLLNLSSVRHSTNLQFINEDFSVGLELPCHAKEGKLSVNWYTAMC